MDLRPLINLGATTPSASTGAAAVASFPPAGDAGLAGPLAAEAGLTPESGEGWLLLSFELVAGDVTREWDLVAEFAGTGRKPDEATGLP